MTGKKPRIALALLLLAFVLGLPTLWTTARSRKADVPQVKSVSARRDDRTGLTVERDVALQEVQTTAPAAGTLWKFTQPRAGSAEFTISAYYEQGASLKKLTSVTKLSLKAAVLDNVGRQLPKQYPKYRQLTQKDLTLNGSEATEVVFEYVSRGVKVKQRLLLLFKNSDTVVYIRGQALAANYDEVSSRYFEPLFSSAKFE